MVIGISVVRSIIEVINGVILSWIFVIVILVAYDYNIKFLFVVHYKWSWRGKEVIISIDQCSRHEVWCWLVYYLDEWGIPQLYRDWNRWKGLITCSDSCGGKRLIWRRRRLRAVMIVLMDYLEVWVDWPINCRIGGV